VPLYAEHADLLTYGLGKGTEDEEIDADEITKALKGAADIADGYLGASGSPFTLPLTSWGDDLRVHVSWIAAFLLMSANGYNPEAGQNDLIESRYRMALEWLEKVSAGDITPGGVVDSTPPDTTSQATVRVTSSSSRGFSSRGDSPGVPFVGSRGGFVGD
jgi:phage gp36-like protein